MKTTFRRHELPVAFAMIETAGRVKPRRDGRHPYDRYFLLWTAFSNIYQAIAAQAGLQSRLVTDKNGDVLTRLNGSLQIPVVDPAGERDQIRLALEALPGEVKHSLVCHPATRFFKDRSPYWDGQKIEQDAFGQKPNGVLHVSHTTRPDYPVWSPIDPPAFDKYLAGSEDPELRDFLAGQVLDLLFTVRENLVHLSRKFDDSNDHAVIEHALSLLQYIVRAFTT